MSIKDILKIGVVAGVVAILGLLGLQKLSTPSSLGGAAGGLLIENYIPYVMTNGGINSAKPITTSGALSTTGTLQVGSAGTQQSNQINTTCSPKADVSIAATSSGYAYCTGVTGVTSADNVDATFSTSTAGWLLTKDNFWIISAKASTTAGAVDFMVYNGTGAAAVPSAVGRAASTTVVQAGH
jgi:hypothetical protein